MLTSTAIDVTEGREYFRGLIDEVRIYSTPLTAADFKSIYDVEKDGRD
jgi:hypothetical protein